MWMLKVGKIVKHTNMEGLNIGDFFERHMIINMVLRHLELTFFGTFRGIQLWGIVNSRGSPRAMRGVRAARYDLT